jgi:glycosyltransferase involved in cell wall biosynthesis
MRILLVNAHGADLDRGGAEKYVHELAAGLRRAGDNVDLLSAFPATSGNGAMTAATLHATDWRDDPVRRIRNHLGDLVSSPTSRLHDAVAATRPDVVHTNNLPGITTAIWEVCGRLGLPVVHTIHDYYLLCPRVTLQRRDGRACCPHTTFCRLRSARLRRWARAVGDTIAGSDHVRRRHESLLRETTFHVVPMPITPLTNPQLCPPRTPPLAIGYLGSLSLVKGITDLVEAAPRLAELGYQLQIAGEGPLRPVVEAAASRGELRYVGPVHGNEKLRFIESTDLAVLPSTWEEPGGPPYAVAEWLAARRPVIITRRGGLGEVPNVAPGAVTTEAGTDGIVAATRAVTEPTRWRDLLTSIPEPDEAAMQAWIDRHREIYEGAAVRGPSGGKV